MAASGTLAGTMARDTQPTLGLIGAGNMASAMVRGWVRADRTMGERILVTDRGSGRAADLAERFDVRHVASNADLVREADVVVLCVKPIDVERVLREVSELVTVDKAIASVAAGVRTATLETILDVDAPVFRFMPNVGVQVGLGTLAYSSGPVHPHRRRVGRAGGIPAAGRDRAAGGAPVRRGDRAVRLGTGVSSASCWRRSRTPASCPA